MVERFRSVEFVEAHRQFGCIGDLGVIESDKFHTIEILFKRWREKYSRGRFVRLICGDEFLFVRCFTRFMKAYSAKLHRELGFLQFVKFRTLITFTVDAKCFLRLSDEYAWIVRSWNKLNSALKHRFGRFFFLRVLEVTKLGRPHLHVLTTLSWVDVVWLRRLWVKYGGGKMLHISNVDSGGLGYVLKYVAKSRDFIKYGLSGLLYFASNRRVFSMNSLIPRGSGVGLLEGEALAEPVSVNLDSPPLSNSNLYDVSKSDLRNLGGDSMDNSNKWLYSGCVPEHLVLAFCVEYAIALRDFMIFSFVYGWSELFGIWDL